MINFLRSQNNFKHLDPILTLTLIFLMSVGLVMVASSSFAVAQQSFTKPFYYFINQSIRLILGLLCFAIMVNVPLSFIKNHAKKLLLLSFILLTLVLIPGIGRTVNGSTRWLDCGIIRIQVSEIAKLCVIIYLSRYIVVYQERVKTNIVGFINAMLMVSLVVFLLLCEPDFGASVVLVTTALCLLFLGGVSLWAFALLVSISLSSFSILAISSPYRMSRLTGFLDPWANQFDSGYQLTQSLIAFGRGGWFGVGLGESVQKLFYLPEAHTDFIFAVIIEELGLLGGVLVLVLYGVFFIRGMQIGKKAHVLNLHFNGYLAQGITVLIIVQALINIGVNTGILPTKGLNLPLISYGGSNLIITYITLAILFRVSIENKL